MDSMAIPMANLGTNMFTNPTVVQLHVKMHGFYGDNHIGELECMQNARENIPQSSMYAKYAGNPRRRTFRPATAQPYRRAQMYAKHEGKHTSELNVCKICRKSQAANFPASYRTAI